MNIIQVQDDLKNFSEQQLIDEIQSPSGIAPQFLVLSELTRRKRVKEDFNARQAEQQPTVAQEAIASAGMPQEIMPQMAESLAPKSASELSGGVGTSMPMNMRTGGLASFGGEIRGKVGEDIDPFLNEVADMAESRFNIQLDSLQDSRPNMPAEPQPAIDFGDRFPQPAIDFGIEPRPARFIGGIGSAFGGGKGRARAYGFNQGGLLGDYDEDMDFSNMSMEEMLEFMKRMKGLSSPMKMNIGGGVTITEEDLDALRFVESSNNPMAFNKATGAAGPYQILKSTAQKPGFDTTPIDPADRYDEEKARKFARQYLEGIARANPSFTKQQVFEAYHSGSENVKKGKLGTQGKSYYGKILSALNPISTAVAKPQNQGNVTYKRVDTEKKDNSASSIDEDTVLNFINANKGNSIAIRNLAEQYYNKSTDKINKALIDSGFNPKVIPQTSEFGDELPTFTGGITVGNQPVVKTKTKEMPDLDEELGSNIPKSVLDLLSTEEKKFVTPSSRSADPGGITEDAETLEEEKKRIEEEKKKAQEKKDGTTETKKDESGKGVVYDKELTGITGDRSDLESDILKLQRQLEKDRDVDKWLSIAKAGLAIADPTKTLSEAAETGIDAMTEARKRYSDGVIDLINARAKLLKSGKTGLKLSELFTNLDRIEKAVLTFSEMGATPDPAKVRELNARKRQILQRISKFPGYESFKPIENPDQKVS